MIKLLIVDDNAVLRQSIKTTLKCENSIKIVGECRNGKEVISFLENMQPNVILMDYHMPILDGIETTRLVKMKFPKIKIIGFSCDDSLHSQNAFKQSGADYFLSKFVTDRITLIKVITLNSKR